MEKMWTEMFHPGVPLLEKMLRPIIVYGFLVLGVRLAGKRQLAQLNPFDLIVLLTLSNTVQNAIIGEDNSVVGGLVGAATLLAINYLVVRFMYGHAKVEHLIEGQPDVLIEGGKIRDDCCRKELITREELEAAARRQGFGSLEEVERAVLEPGGTLAFVGRKPPPEHVRHGELKARLDEIARTLAELRTLAARPEKP
jgi:uncharacterized membrane protein YcaP (DUF421 family)